jgi:serine/threonine protein kinase
MQHLQPNTTLQGGKYRIERVLGQGGFGITYLATQASLNRYVAIKELFMGGEGQAINDRRGNMVVVTNPVNQASFYQQKEKFKKEALRLENLNHPNLVKVHEFFEENGTAYYVMDYIDGESLRSKLNKEGRLTESLVLKYLQQLLPALETAHRQNIWHLDIKPENIVVDRYYHAYLIDFGASKHIEPNSTLTTSLFLAYTPGYCPPELSDLSKEAPDDYIQALKEIGPWTDIYSLGATMYNLLTDNMPPSSKRIERNGRNAFAFPNSVSSSTQDLIVWMMQPNKEDRPQNVQAVIYRLNNPSTIGLEDTIIEGNSVSHNIGNSSRQDGFQTGYQRGASSYISEGTWAIKSKQELENEAMEYYRRHDIDILNQYGFFQQKKKRQASIIWASCLVSFFLSLIAAFLIIESNGWEHSGLAGTIIYPIAIMCGVVPGIYIGPVIMGMKDNSQFDALAESIKRQFINDYISKNSR